MREMSTELRLGRVRALEAERATALRESARQVAHELKNPLTPIRFAIARLRREAPESLSETIDVLETESLASRGHGEELRAVRPTARRTTGAGGSRRVGAECRAQCGAAGSSMTIDVADDVPMVQGHVDALGRALTNVLLNAVEASQVEAPIALYVRRTTRGERAMVEVTVRDEGSGISAARMARIWEPYVTHKAGGTGLGLAIVRQTVLAHDGFVEVESAPGQGTTMRLVLPVDAPALDSRGENGR